MREVHETRESVLDRLVRLRHTEPRMSRFVHNSLGNVGSTKTQYIRLRKLAKEGNRMATEIINKIDPPQARPQVATLRTINATLPNPVYEKYQKLRGATKLQHAEWIAKLVDFYERHGDDPPPAQGPTLKLAKEALSEITTLAAMNSCTIQEMVGKLIHAWQNPITLTKGTGITTECANILREYQTKTGAASQLEALQQLRNLAAKGLEVAAVRGQLATTTTQLEQEKRRSAELHQRAESFAAKLETEAKRAENLQSELAVLMRDLELAKSQPTAAAVPTAPTEEEKLCLLDFVDAFTGSTATADASGELVVSIPQEKQSIMFSVWGRAVKALGIAKKAA